MKLSGRKVILLSSSLTFLFFVKQPVFAEVKTTINSEVEGNGSSNVHVESNTNSSNTTTTTTSSNGRTDIVIECNGVKKEYHSDKAENVNLNCDDTITGTVKSEIKISTATASPTAHPTIVKDDEEMKEGAKEKVEEMKKEKTTIFDELKKLFDNLFKSFHF